MRTFVAVGHTAPLTPDFPLDDLAGSAGRLDVLCRYITAAFLLSHDIRDDVRVFVVIQDELTLEFRGDELRNLNPDERSTAALVRDALKTADDRAFGSRPVASSPGIYARRQGVAETLDIAGGVGIRLSPMGDRLSTDAVPVDPTFILSDHLDFTDAEQERIDGHVDRTASLGPKAVHGNHAIAIAHNICDRAETG